VPGAVHHDPFRRRREHLGHHLHCGEPAIRRPSPGDFLLQGAGSQQRGHDVLSSPCPDPATETDQLVTIWHMLADESDYADLGADWFDRRSDNERHARRLAHQIERLGYKVTVEPAA